MEKTYKAKTIILAKVVNKEDKEKLEDQNKEQVEESEPTKLNKEYLEESGLA